MHGNEGITNGRFIDKKSDTGAQISENRDYVYYRDIMSKLQISRKWLILQEFVYKLCLQE